MHEFPVVKEYTEKYQTQVVDLILRIQQEEYNIPITKDDQPDLFTIEEFYQSGKGNFWVALYEEEVVGTIGLIDIGNDQAALRKVFVNKEFRGSKFNTARLLLNNVIQWARDQSIKEVYLGTTPQFLAAHRFYEKNGFINVAQSELPENFPVLRIDKKFYKYKVD
ncbi:GNAT family N-acetyltransferase [Bacillus sp. V5-8f]|uniref:GNAT family N-acetyltransferase n=1 Tax=Bacillus sp. V5-8f TaxID=2053044 RepID=UPI000C7823EF|nr:GNAT family N-acetyltransferase [Bacillus sp. V5-8f]PLT33198.1 GNAT family N-acetyltransferase [Bacillus sp. V5-8f]